MTWKKGQSGNPGGRAAIPDHLKKSCQRLSVLGLKALEDIITSKTKVDENGKVLRLGAKDADRIAATRLVLEYAYGRPAQTLDLPKDGGGVVVHVLTLADSSWDEE